MKNKVQDVDDDPLDREFDFTHARPNPYWLGMVDRSCVRVLDKDLAHTFPDDAAVNAALRTLAEVSARLAAPQEQKQKRSARTAAAPRPSTKKKARTTKKKARA
jgi:sRNA-binding protein